MAAINFILSTGFTDELLIVCTVPLVFCLELFLRTIMLDSEISAEAAPFLLAFALELELSSDWLVDVDCWFIPFLKQSLR